MRRCRRTECRRESRAASPFRCAFAICGCISPSVRLVIRSASEMPSTTSSGSSPLPRVFDIFWPSASRTSPVMWTLRNGTSPMKCSVIMIIRATQKKMMSCPVTSTSVGWYISSSRVCSGQPSVPNVHIADENQVSRTSSSARSATSSARLYLRRTSASSRATYIAPFCVVPGGNAVSPPLLAADAPVADVAHPGEVQVFVLLRYELDVAALRPLRSRASRAHRLRRTTDRSAAAR